MTSDGMAVAPSLADRLGPVAAGLRLSLAGLVQCLAGEPARPIRLMRAAGLDKSLASRLVQATRAESDAEFLHRVPSPTGLRMLLDASAGQVPDELRATVATAVDAFQSLLDQFPGGRLALDAHLGATQIDVRERREHMARQASFKAMTFLFGHYCDTVSTAVFVLPSASGDAVDFVEVHRRIGLHRVTPGTSLPLLSLYTELPALASGPRLTSLEGEAVSAGPGHFFLADPGDSPLPAMCIEQEAETTTFVLSGDDPTPTPERITTAFRVAEIVPCDLQAPALPLSLRTYMLHTPCQRLVRDVFIAEALWPLLRPQVAFFLPGPSGMPMRAATAGQRHYRELPLSARIEALPEGADAWTLPGVPDHQQTLLDALQRAGLGAQRFRAWRCEMAYPVPLVEMQIALGAPSGPVGTANPVEATAG
ncbi:MAG: hypothetical protein WA086_14900 [Ideonella sp.]